MLPPSEKAIFVDNAIIAYAKKKDMIKHNIAKVNANRQSITPIVSECNCAAVKSESADQDAGLPMTTIISKNTVFRLTANLWTEAGLTNGSEGVIHYDSYALSIHKLQGNTSERLTLMQEKRSLLPDSCVSAARGPRRSKDSHSPLPKL